MERPRSDVHTLLPAARSDLAPGLASLPDGAACYAALVRRHTTLSLPPLLLEQRGREDLRRIHEEIAELGAALFGVSTAVEVLQHLRDEASLRFHSEDEVLTFAREALVRAEAVLGEVSTVRPRAPLEVRAVPAYAAPFNV